MALLFHVEFALLSKYCIYQSMWTDKSEQIEDPDQKKSKSGSLIRVCFICCLPFSQFFTATSPGIAADKRSIQKVIVLIIASTAHILYRRAFVELTSFTTRKACRERSELYGREYDQGKVTYNNIYFQQKLL